MDALPDGHRVRPLLIDGPQGHHPPDKDITKAVLSAAVLGEELSQVAS